MKAVRYGVWALGCIAAAAWQGPTVQAQSAYGPMAGGAGPGFVAPGGYQRVTGQTNPALTYFGGARAVYHAPRGRMQMPGPQPVQSAAYVKPFHGLQSTGSISPYLALDQRDTEGGAPSYYTFVKPQLDQQATNQQLQLQNRRLQQQLRRATTAGIVPQGTSGGIPTTGHSTQFMNRGGYYPQLTR